MNPVRGLGHLRVRRRLSALAEGTLAPATREAVRAHVAGCAACAAELAALEAVIGLVARDPRRHAEPPVSVEALRTRVLARLDARPLGPSQSRPHRWVWVLAATGAVAAVAVAMLVARRPAPAPLRDASAGPLPSPASEVFLARMERQLVRDQAARYLGDAQDLLLAVASTRADCQHDPESLDLEAETRRGRELVARRALMVDSEGGSLASVRPVIEVVDALVGDVARLPACARRADLESIHAEIEERQVLLKISLLKRELTG